MQGEGFIWAICEDDQLCGTIAVKNGDLGYMLSPALHGKGIATMAAKRAIDHAFATSDRPHLTASTWYDNPASARVLQKHGFVHWATRYVQAKARGLPTLVHNHRLRRNDWDRLRTTPQ